MYFDQGWSEKKKGKKPPRSFQPIDLTADANLNYVDKSTYSGNYFSLCTTPAILTEIKCMIWGKEENLEREAGNNPFNPSFNE